MVFFIPEKLSLLICQKLLYFDSHLGYHTFYLKKKTKYFIIIKTLNRKFCLGTKTLNLLAQKRVLGQLVEYLV